MMPDDDAMTPADRAALAALDSRADALTHRPTPGHGPESLDAALSRLRHAAETCTSASLTVRMCRRLLARLGALAGPLPLASIAEIAAKSVVLIPCDLTPGAFSQEWVFFVRDHEGLRGVADADYCYHGDGRKFSESPPSGGRVAGKVVGVVVAVAGDGTASVYMPDGEVYHLDVASLQLAGPTRTEAELKEAHAATDELAAIVGTLLSAWSKDGLSHSRCLEAYEMARAWRDRGKAEVEGEVTP